MALLFHDVWDEQSLDIKTVVRHWKFPHIIFPDIVNARFICTACLIDTGTVVSIAVHKGLYIDP